MINTFQMRLFDSPLNPQVKSAIEILASSGAEERGAVFTRSEVANFILDLVGYTPEKPLHRRRLLEPAFGHGDFLIPVIERLMKSYWADEQRSANPLDDLAESISAIELHTKTFNETANRLLSQLVLSGLREKDASALLKRWLVQGDYLIEPISGTFDHVVGNPPYIRQEIIPNALLAEYRRRFQTMYDRADIYIPFIEKSLSLLGDNGVLGFICSDRWMKNKYGGPLRKLVSEHFHLKFYVDMVDTPAFHSEVSAYPAIFVIQNDRPGATRIAVQPQIDQQTLSTLAFDLVSGRESSEILIREVNEIGKVSEPWVFDSSQRLSLVRRLEAEFPTLEEAGCQVGIGVATGADQVFIDLFEALDVEPDRKLPLVMTRDILSGMVKWQGHGVINPFDDQGNLVTLQDYPRLARYLNEHAAQLRERHVSKKNPGNWYRTIDRIYPELAKRPKLLIPDIKGEASIVYEEGRLYPHHNLYYITSDHWDLRALQTVLKSGIARLFISTYSTKMRGGYLRFQAQYLRRIRLPRWSNIEPELRATLVNATKQEDVSQGFEGVSHLYGLSSSEKEVLQEIYD